jgi:hypothetical protein
MKQIIAAGRASAAICQGRRGQRSQLCRSYCRADLLAARDPVVGVAGTAVAAGIRYAGMAPNISLVLLREAILGLAAISVQALMPLNARDLVHSGSAIKRIAIHPS